MSRAYTLRPGSGNGGTPLPYAHASRARLLVDNSIVDRVQRDPSLGLLPMIAVLLCYPPPLRLAVLGALNSRNAVGWP